MTDYVGAQCPTWLGAQVLARPFCEDALRSHPCCEVSAGYSDKVRLALVTVGLTSSLWWWKS